MKYSIYPKVLEKPWVQNFSFEPDFEPFACYYMPYYAMICEVNGLKEFSSNKEIEVKNR